MNSQEQLEHYVSTCTRAETLALLRFCLEAVTIEDIAPAIKEVFDNPEVVEIAMELSK